MSRRLAALILGGVTILAATALVWWLLAGRSATTPGRQAPLAASPAAPGATTESELYFPAPGGRLGSERRELPATDSPEERIAQVVQAVLAGPAEPGLYPALAAEVVLTDVHLASDGVAFVDLGAAGLASPPVAGSRGEMQTVYSFVNSILTNVPEAHAVVLLWNGSQRPTFAGHLDTTRPLAARRDWLPSR